MQNFKSILLYEHEIKREVLKSALVYLKNYSKTNKLWQKCKARHILLLL